MIKIDIHGIMAIGDILDLTKDKESKRRRKRQEFLEMDKKVQGNARRLAFEELLTAYQSLVSELAKSRSFVDITSDSYQDTRKVKVRAYEVVHGVTPKLKQLSNVPYDLRVYQNPRMLMDVSLTVNPLEHDGCSQLEVLMAAPETLLIIETARILQDAVQIPFRLSKKVLAHVNGEDLRGYSSVREIISLYKLAFEKTEVYPRLKGKELFDRQGELIFEGIDILRHKN